MSHGDMRRPSPPESPRMSLSGTTSPSPPQPIPIQMVGTPGRPQMHSSNIGTPILMTPSHPQQVQQQQQHHHHHGISIAHTPDRPPRVWATGPMHHLHHQLHLHHHGHQQQQQQQLSMQYQERQDVNIDSSLEENELVGLDLSSARIRSLPLGLLNYTDFLTELRLNGNLLTGLPPQVGELRSLVILDLSDNHISFLPLELGKLTNLVELLLFNNKLSGLPPEIGYLYQLENLGLDGNPWDEPVAGVLMTQGPMAVVPYLRDTLLGTH